MDQKKILITGVTKGLGRSLLKPLSDYGHILLGCSRSLDQIKNVKKVFEAPHRFDGVDVTDWDAVLTWSEALLDDEGPIDMIINNAGVINPNAPLWQISDETFTKVMDVNVRGTVNMIRAFVPSMIRAKKGIIINISSGWGRSAAPDVAPYCASKWAIEGLTKSLSQELPEGLAAIAINPGVINTDMLQSCWGHSANDAISPTEWAEKAARFFLSLSTTDNGKSLSIR